MIYHAGNPVPIPEDIKKHLKYDNKKGFLIWFNPRANSVKVGSIAGSIDAFGYILVTYKSITYKAHRIAWFIHHGKQPKIIDHINGNKSDNRIANLRSCTQSQNSMNRKVHQNNTSGVTGVVWNSLRKKWIARIGVDYKIKFLGYYDTKEEAIHQRKTAENQYYKEYNHEKRVCNATNK